MASIGQTLNSILVENFGKAPNNWDDCKICLVVKDEELTGHTTASVVHQYHLSCLNTWLTKNPSCPECRQPFISRDIEVMNTEQTEMPVLFNVYEALGEIESFLFY